MSARGTRARPPSCACARPLARPPKPGAARVCPQRRGRRCAPPPRRCRAGRACASPAICSGSNTSSNRPASRRGRLRVESGERVADVPPGSAGSGSVLPYWIRSLRAILKSQIATSSLSHGGRRKLPVAFTKHGALMAANILNSPRAVAMSVYVIRAFVKMREDVAANAAILRRLAEIDKTLLVHDVTLGELVQKLRPLLEPPPQPPKPEIGFHVKEDAVPYRTRRRGKA